MSKKVGNITHKNGLMKKESKLLKILVKEPWKAFTVTEINRTYKTKSHHYVPEALKKFSKMGIIKEETRGNTKIYSINYETNEHISYFAFIEASIKEDRADIPFKSIKQVTDGIKSHFYALLVGGSYAEGTQKSASDMDIAIIIPNCEEKKSFEAALRRGELILPEIHGLVFTQTEFYEMLVNKEYNYGKEIAKKHIIFYGAEAYYKILFEAMRYGFKG